MEPEAPTVPIPGARLTEVALAELQLNVTDCPASMVCGLALSCAVGAGVGPGPAAAPPQLVVSNTSTPRKRRRLGCKREVGRGNRFTELSCCCWFVQEIRRWRCGASCARPAKRLLTAACA